MHFFYIGFPFISGTVLSTHCSTRISAKIHFKKTKKRKKSKQTTIGFIQRWLSGDKPNQYFTKSVVFERWEVHGRKEMLRSTSKLQATTKAGHHFKQKQWPNTAHLDIVKDTDITISSSAHSPRKGDQLLYCDSIQLNYHVPKTASWQNKK